VPTSSGVIPVFFFSTFCIRLDGSHHAYRALTFNWYLTFPVCISIMGNAQSVRHEPSPYHAATTTNGPKPKKSLLRRSRSIRSSADEGAGLEPSTNEKTRYIPKMNQSEGGLIMPSRPYGSNPPSGVESPQWGWYINTTPPTPDMYQSPNGKFSKQANRQGCSSQPIQSQHMDGGACHNQVFQNLQNANRPMGWTSVPI
jgi:hypothetical protein